MTKTQTKAPDASLDVAVEEREAWRRRLTITVDASRVTRARRKEREKLAKKLRLKGFRTGKVPAHVVEQRYGELVDQRTVQRLVEDAYREAVRREKLDPVGSPEFGQVRYGRDENLTFQVDFEIMPTLKLERVGGFRIRRPEVSASDEDVEGVIERLREERGVWEPREASPEDGDLVAVRITRQDGDESGGMAVGAGRPAGEPGGETGELYRFPLGSGYAIPDVERAIRTLGPGESGSFDVSFPEDFSDASLVGEARHLEIELVEVKRRRLAPLDDGFASEVGDFDTLDGLRERVRDDLLRHRAEEAEQRTRDDIMDSIIEANAFDAPSSLIDAYLDRIVGSEEKEDGVPEAEADQVAEARESVRPIAEQQLKREMVLEHLIEQLEIEATEQRIEAYVTEEARRRDVDAKDLRRRWQRKGGLETLRRRVVIEGVFEHLKGLSTIE